MMNDSAAFGKVSGSMRVLHLTPAQRVEVGEMSALEKRRSLYFSADVKAGALLDNTNVQSIRPGLGLPPKHYDAILGARAATDITRGTPTSWDLINQSDNPGSKCTDP